MQKERRNDRIQGVLFDARPIVFAGSSRHPKAWLLSARQFAQRLATFSNRTRRQRRPDPIPTHYRLATDATELLRRFK